jgi:hypothetical protein
MRWAGHVARMEEMRGVYRFLLERLISFQLVKKFPAIYGNRSFITAFTSVRHLSLSVSQLTPLHYRPPLPTSRISILILSSHLRLALPSDFFPSVFPTKTLYTLLTSPYALHAPPLSFSSILSPAQFWVRSTEH